jgi:hypothetical protein
VRHLCARCEVSSQRDGFAGLEAILATLTCAVHPARDCLELMTGLIEQKRSFSPPLLPQRLDSSVFSSKEHSCTHSCVNNNDAIVMMASHHPQRTSIHRSFAKKVAVSSLTLCAERGTSIGQLCCLHAFLVFLRLPN